MAAPASSPRTAVLPVSEHSIATKRWVAKKLARLAVGVGAMPLTWRAGSRERIRVLTYHRFVAEARSPFSVAPDVLERQMAWLAAAGLAVDSRAVAETLAGRIASRHGVLVTMDDGDPSVFDAAAPIFARHRIPYVVFAVPGRIGRADHMSAAQLRELADAGAEIGSHSMHHRSMTSLTGPELAADLSDSRKALEDIVGKPVTSFAYPFGTLRDFDARVARALADAGYALGFTSQHGAISPGQSPQMAPRVKIEGGDPDWLFRAACAGAMDAWRLIDAGLSGLQKPEAKDTAALTPLRG
jgi:peptidoglycan/xylan/chitin deacetylase (PgdA/CDA1 family)